MTSSQKNSKGSRRSQRVLDREMAKMRENREKRKQPDLAMQGREPKMSILMLPNEILLLIAKFMDVSSLAATVRAARFMNDLLDKELYNRAVSFVPRRVGSVVEWAAKQGRPETIRKVCEKMPANTDWDIVIVKGIAQAIFANQVTTLDFLCSDKFKPSRAGQCIRDPPSSLDSLDAVMFPGNPVDVAAYIGSVGVLRYLREKGVPFGTPGFYYSAFMFEGGNGWRLGDTQVAEELVRLGFNSKLETLRGTCNQSLLHDVATRGSTAHVDLLARAVPELLNLPDVDGRTPLMYAIASMQMHCARHMVTVTGADVNLGNSNGVTALHMAVCGDDTRLVEALISRGADVNARTLTRLTPLHMVTDTSDGKIKNPQMVEILLSRGAFCSPRDKKGNTPLSNALAAQNIRHVEWLMRCAKHHAYEFQDTQQLLDACRVGSLQIVQIYAQREGFNIEEHEDHWHRSALHLAAIGGYVKILSFLLPKWKNVDHRDVGGRTALWYACCKIKSACAYKLVRAGASLDSADESGRTPLMNFTKHVRSEPTMAYFLKSSEKLEAVDMMGRTLLHHAARYGNVSATRSIVRYRRKLAGQFAMMGQSALLIALKYHRRRVARFLRRVILLRRKDYSWLAMNGFHKEVTWIGQGRGWARTRKHWTDRREELESLKVGSRKLGRR
ncbi:ankyrin repeat domain-containing protein [Aspergillus affinis]|uniref:ankyrin repeat domain-containing protein n=1 Tax=Aspergillus affinis TaxID=1070780 RepID=UPI0022FDB29C|nr:ankyrin [Aspergillus affinis]KAI9041441.1 ankyrin [Aspergillus affinis]